MQLPRWTLNRKWIALVLGVTLVGSGIISVGFLVFGGGDSPDPPVVYNDSRRSPDSLLARLQVTPTPTPTASPTSTPQPTQEPSPVVAEIIAPPETHQSAPVLQSTPTPQPAPSPEPEPTPTTAPTPTPTPTPAPALQPAEVIALFVDWYNNTYYGHVNASQCSALWNGSWWEIPCTLSTGVQGGIPPISYEATFCLFEATLTFTRCD